MYHFYRTIMLSLLWLSLLLIPYFFLSYLGWGISMGAVAKEVKNHPYYLSLMKHYTWLYPLVVFCSLYFSKNLKPSLYAASILWIPIIFLIPAAYASYQIWVIENKYARQTSAHYSIQPNDFVCSSEGKFIRYAI